MDHAAPTGADGAPPTELVLYTRPGCGLCDETRLTLDALLARRSATGRPAPPVVERDIETDPALERALFAEIPVVELGGRRLALATSPARIERLLAEVLDR
jgi:glutaredoxin